MRRMIISYMYEGMSKNKLVSQCINKDKKIDCYTHELSKCNILTKTILCIYINAKIIKR